MLGIVYNLLGISMLIWYSCLRWTMFKDPVKYAWAYAHINIFTGYMSFLFIIPTLCFPLFTGDSYKIYTHFILFLGIFLFIRNTYYTYEDIMDYISLIDDRKQQLFFIVIDLCMVVYTLLWYIKYGVNME